MGRERWSEVEAGEVLSEWRESGISLSEFARKRGLQAQRLSFWKKRLEEEKPRLLPAVVVNGAAVTLRLPDGLVIESSEQTSAEWLGTLLRELRK
jgi:hypothetical protein